MSFFKKDYGAYPQPVVVIPDPSATEVSISDAVADAIATPSSSQLTETTAASMPLANKHNRLGSHRDPSTAGHSKQPTEEELQQQQEQQRQQQQQQKDTTEKLADGIMSLLGPIVQEMDFNIVSVRKSQTELEKEIERLMAELQLFMASSAAPPEVEPAVQKLVKARRQIMTANLTLKTVQDRVDRMHQQIERRQ
ncbi:hypothetical protein EDD11_003318 [Mortierella claussenii]|nr:hypothetical protein EDD11_003318 [Mortierella claussenii]